MPSSVGLRSIFSAPKRDRSELKVSGYSEERLERLANMIGDTINFQRKELKFKKGGGWIRKDIDTVNVQTGEIFVKDGSEMDWHSHDCMEMIGVISGGKVKVFFNSKIMSDLIMEPGTPCYIIIPENVPHRIEYIGDSNQWYTLIGLNARAELSNAGKE